MGSILVENGTVVTINGNDEVFNSGYVFIEDDLITAVGAGETPPQYKRADTVINARFMAVMQGMINAHTHLFQTFLRGQADDKPLLDWLKTAIWPVAHFDPRNDDGVCRAANETGIRFLLARGWADMGYRRLLMETQEKIISETERLRDQWEVAGNGRTRVEYAPLIPWGCSDDTMLRSHKISKGWNSGTHIHVAETKTEVDMNLQLIAARIGAELGSDWVKISHADDFGKVTSTCYVPTVILGGAKKGSERVMLEKIRSALDVGAKGVAIGRNIFQADDPQSMTAAALIHENVSVDDAIKILTGSR